MSLGADRRLRVNGTIHFSPDGRGRRRPLVHTDFVLIALEDGPNGLTPIASLTNGIRVTSDAEGNFARSLVWEIPGRTQGPLLPEPDGFEVQVTDPGTGQLVPAGEVRGNGDDLVIDAGFAPDELPLALGPAGQEFDEISELASHLAAALANPGTLGEVTVLRPYFLPADQRHPTGAERLFRHFTLLLDTLQAALRNTRGPGATGSVPSGFKPLEERVVKVLAWYPRGLTAAQRCQRLVAGHAQDDPSEELLRRVVPRLTMMLGQILQLPVANDDGRYLWEDLAVLLTLIAGIGLVAQHNHAVWADYRTESGSRKLVLSIR